jgi:putative ABC transport system permease protein
MIVLATIVALAGGLAALFWWQPFLRRVVLRNIARRPREAALIVAASVFGTAMLSGALVVADSVRQSMRQSAADRLGPVDDLALFGDVKDADDLVATMTAASPPGIDGAIAIQTADVAVTAGRRSVGRAGIVAVGEDISPTLGEVPRVKPGEVVLTKALAKRLNVAAGASLHIGRGSGARTLRVADVVPGKGIAGFSPRIGAEPLNLVVARATLRDLRDAGLVNQATFVGISNDGSALRGAHQTATATSAALSVSGSFVTGLQPVKQEALAAADVEADALGRMLLTGAIFGVVAGLMLLAGIFVMLADDRTAELGLLQALGMRRRTAMTAFVAEGACYAIPGAVAGLLTGTAFAWVLLRMMNAWFTAGWRGESVPVNLHLVAGALEAGLLLGIAGSLLAVACSAWRISRRSIATAQRGATETRSFALPAPESSVRVAGLAGLLLVWAIVWGRPAGMVVLAMGAAIALTPWLAQRWASLRHAATVTVVVAIGASLLVIPYARTRDLEVSSQLLALQGLASAALAVAVLMLWEAPLGRLFARVRRRAVAGRLAVAYPQTHPARTALNIGLFTLVTFSVVFALITGTAAQHHDPTGARAAGRFDLVASAPVGHDAPLAALRKARGVAAVAPLASTRARVQLNYAKGAVDRPVTVFDEHLLASTPPRLLNRGDYKDDEAAFRAVLANSDLVIVSDTLLAPLVPRPVQRLRPGDRLLLANPIAGSAREVKVAATFGFDTLSFGILTSTSTAEIAIGSPPPVDRLLLATRSGTAVAVAKDLNAHFAADGVAVEPTAAVATRVAGDYGAFARALAAAQALGLVAGLCGLAVVMARSVRERRRDLGTLRALGGTRRTAGRAVALETVFVAGQGLALGVLLATMTSFVGQGSLAAGVAYVYPLRAILVIVLVVLAVSVLAALAPVRYAQRLEPAAALRNE